MPQEAGWPGLARSGPGLPWSWRSDPRLAGKEGVWTRSGEGSGWRGGEGGTCTPVEGRSRRTGQGRGWLGGSEDQWGCGEQLHWGSLAVDTRVAPGGEAEEAGMERRSGRGEGVRWRCGLGGEGKGGERRETPWEGGWHGLGRTGRASGVAGEDRNRDLGGEGRLGRAGPRLGVSCRKTPLTPDSSRTRRAWARDALNRPL